MIPPPMINSFFGTSFNLRASVESQTRGSSCGMNGNWIGREPAAIIALSNLIVVGLPSRSRATNVCGSVNAAKPSTTVTLRCLAMPARPPVNLATTASLPARTSSKSMRGSAKYTPFLLACFASSITFATWSNALEGIQPTFKHTPPNVE